MANTRHQSLPFGGSAIHSPADTCYTAFACPAHEKITKLSYQSFCTSAVIAVESVDSRVMMRTSFLSAKQPRYVEEDDVGGVTGAGVGSAVGEGATPISNTLSAANTVMTSGRSGNEASENVGIIVRQRRRP